MNEYIEYVDRYTVRQLLQDVQSFVTHQVDDLVSAINTLSTFASGSSSEPNGEVQRDNNQYSGDANAFSAIDRLHLLQAQLAFLNKKRFDENKIHAVRVDLKARASGYPIKPKRKLIVVLGGMLGLMAGVTVAFIREAVYRVIQSRERVDVR